jgi:hypothetical protein
MDHALILPPDLRSSQLIENMDTRSRHYVGIPLVTLAIHRSILSSRLIPVNVPFQKKECVMSKPSHHRALFAVVAILLIASPAAFASHAWSTYHWNKPGSTVTLVLGDNTAGVWDTYLANVESDWDQSTVLTLSVGAGATTGRKCRPTAGKVEVCNAAYGTNGWLGLAQIWLSGGHISQGVAKMNDSYFMYESEKRHVMCQEVGHTFGLGHTSEDGTSQNTCMDYYANTSNTDMTSTTPNAHDYAQLATIYAHVGAVGVGTNSVAMMPPALGMIDFAGPEQWGTEIESSADGRSRIYRLDFGTNHEGEHIELLTHVFAAGPNNPEMDSIDRDRPWLRTNQ